MKLNVRFCALAVTITLFATALVAQVTSKPVAVTVVNTTANPVPTQATGTTAVTGAVQISNTPSVQVTNTPNVSLSNTSANPIFVRRVDSSPAQPFQAECFAPVGVRDATCTLALVPAGQRLVIETVTAHMNIDQTQEFGGIFLENLVGGTSADFFIAPSFGPVQAGRYVVEATHQVRIYADPGTSVVMSGNAGCITSPTCIPGFAGFAFTISGYLVPVP